jgi:hypothetical protein
VIGRPADRKKLVFVPLNNGDNAFIEFVSPTILDYKLMRDASLRDAKMIRVGLLPKESSLRDAPLASLFVIPQNSQSREHPAKYEHIILNTAIIFSSVAKN